MPRPAPGRSRESFGLRIAWEVVIVTRIAAGLVLLAMAVCPATIVWSQPQSGFPVDCTRPHPNYVCIRMWNQLANARVTFLIDQTPQGSAEAGQSIYTTTSPGSHQVEAIVAGDPTDHQRRTVRTVNWAPGDNATYCIFEVDHGGC